MTTWGEIYQRHLACGEDHSSAAFVADQWENNQTQQRKKEQNARIRELESRIRELEGKE